MFILTSILVLGILGFIFAGLLALAAQYFHVVEDPRIGQIQKLLPGTNCGACGSAGCHAFAERLVKGEVSVTGCVSGGADVAVNLAKAMGVAEPTDLNKLIAAVHCGARDGQRKKKAKYSGVRTCRAANMIDSGGLLCSWGCLGHGDCCLVCIFDAIMMVDGLPVVDSKKCTACGKCVAACPKNIISIIPADFPVVIACSSKDSGAATRKICVVGCIACKICEKEVPEVFKVEDNLAVIEYANKGIAYDQALAKCPAQCIAQL